MKTKWLSLFLALMMMLTVFAGCGEETVSTPAADNAPTPQQPAEGDTPSIGDNTSDEEKADFPDALTSEKVATVYARTIKMSNDRGVSYYDAATKRYGVMSFDGSSDTGAKYLYCTPLGDYFEVVSELPTGDDLAKTNCSGVVDEKGNVIIPEQYALFRALNDRFVQAFAATGIAPDQSDALFSLRSSIFDTSSETTYYVGEWCIYDMTTGKPVEGVTGTTTYTQNAYGNYIDFKPDEGDSKVINADGRVLENANMIGEGYYYVSSDDVITVYDPDDAVLFTLDADGYKPSRLSKGYIIASKYDGGTREVVMDKQGNIVSAEFDDIYYFLGDALTLDSGALVDLQGNPLTDVTFDNIATNSSFAKQVYCLKSDNNGIMLRSDGTVIVTDNEEDVSLNSEYFVAEKRDETNTSHFYCLKDKDYTILATGVVSPWIVQSYYDSDWNCSLIDTISGNTLAEGYKSYRFVGSLETTLYVYAEKADGNLDILTVTY